jgi:hypothetical protein
VAVGAGVSVAVGVKVKVGGAVEEPVAEAVAEAEFSGSATRPDLIINATIPPAPTSRMATTSSGIDRRRCGAAAAEAAGRARPAAAEPVLSVRSAPQTRHFVAAAPTRVPQVGHSRGEAAEAVWDLVTI